MAQKVLVEIEVDQSGAVTGLDKLDKSVDTVKKDTAELSKSLGGVSGKIDQLSGGLLSTFKGIGSGISTAVKGFGALRVAIAATGIGALLLAVTSLVSFFTKTEKGANQLKVVFAAFGAVVQTIVNGLESIGEGITDIINKESEVDSFWKKFGDAARGAFAQAFPGFDILITKFAAVAEEGAKLQKQLNDIAIEERKLRVERSAANKEIEQQKSIGEDITKSTSERIDALQKASSIEDELLQKELRLARQTLENRRQNLKFAEDEIEAKNEIADLTVKVNELENQSITRQREVQNRLNDLRKQSFEDRVNALEQIRVALLTSNEKEVDDVRKKYEDLLMLARKYGQDTLELERKRVEDLNALSPRELELRTGIDNKKLESAKELARGENKIKALSTESGIDIAEQEQRAKEAIATNALGALSRLAEEGSAEAKAFAAAQVLFDTYKGIQGAFSSNSTNTGATVATAGAWPFIQAAAAAAFGFANLKKVLSAPTKLSGGGGGSGVGRGGSGPSAPSIGQSISLVAPTFGTQDIGSQIQQGLSSSPIRAYTVGQDVTGQQQLDREIAANGRFG